MQEEKVHERVVTIVDTLFNNQVQVLVKELLVDHKQQDQYNLLDKQQTWFPCVPATARIWAR